MWHASVMMASQADRLSAAINALQGVGDATLGEWIEHRSAVHIRRRLSLREQIASGLQMTDMRGTQQGLDRIKKILQVTPGVRNIAMRELNEF